MSFERWSMLEGTMKLAKVSLRPLELSRGASSSIVVCDPLYVAGSTVDGAERWGRVAREREE